MDVAVEEYLLSLPEIGLRLNRGPAPSLGAAGTLRVLLAICFGSPSSLAAKVVIK